MRDRRSRWSFARLSIPLAAIASPAPLIAQLTAEQAIANARVTQERCIGDPFQNEILVCGQRRREDQRLPFRSESGSSGAVRGDVPRASDSPASFGPCGIFEGQRRCSKAENLQFGYGGGRDPITLLGRIGTALLDPDADPAPAPPPGAYDLPD